MKSQALIPIVLILGFTMTGCYSQQQATPRERTSTRVVVVHEQPGPARAVVVKKKPPKARKEVRSRRPSHRHVWVSGHWAWRGNRHVWESGHWAVPPRHKHAWVASEWVARDGGWVFIAGHWR